MTRVFRKTDCYGVFGNEVTLFLNENFVNLFVQI